MHEPGIFYVHIGNDVLTNHKLTVREDGSIRSSAGPIQFDTDYTVETLDEAGTVFQFRGGTPQSPKLFVGDVEKVIRFNRWMVYFADAPTESDTFSFTYAV